MMMIRQEFRLNRFGLDFNPPHDFVVSLWQGDRDRVSGYYVIYRFLLAGLFLSVLVADGCRNSSPQYFFIYFTHLGLVMQTAHLVVSAALPVQFLLLTGGQNRMTYLAKISWVLYTVTNITTLVITVIYWGFIYDPANGLDAMNFMVHGLILITSVIDMWVGARPCRLLHFYQPSLVLLAYFIFGVIYWASGGLNADGKPYIYAIMDWNKPGSTAALLVCAVLFIIPVIHTLMWSIHLLRDRIALAVMSGWRSSKTSPALPFHQMT